MSVPTIANATITNYTNANGILRYEIRSNDGYVLYSISDYNQAVEIGYPEATYFCRYMNVGAGFDFSDIATMAETDIPDGAENWGKPDDEAEKIMNTEREVL